LLDAIRAGHPDSPKKEKGTEAVGQTTDPDAIDQLKRALQALATKLTDAQASRVLKAAAASRDGRRLMTKRPNGPERSWRRRGALTLKEAQSFAAKISGFGTGDHRRGELAQDGNDLQFRREFSEHRRHATLYDQTDGLTANIHLTGGYTKSDFTLAPDSGTGTLVKFV
jgi:hypothetical protein